MLTTVSHAFEICHENILDVQKKISPLTVLPSDRCSWMKSKPSWDPSFFPGASLEWHPIRLKRTRPSRMTVFFSARMLRHVICVCQGILLIRKPYM